MKEASSTMANVSTNNLSVSPRELETQTTTTSVATSYGPLHTVKETLKAILSHIGLALCSIIYVIGGAYVFMAIEQGPAPQVTEALPEKDLSVQATRQLKLREYHNEFTKKLFKIDYGIEDQGYEDAVTEFEDRLHAHYADRLKCDKRAVAEGIDSYTKWQFPSALLFTVSIVTTIGYGHISPSTSTGKLMVIAYAIVGVPLMLMFLANIGDQMARFARLGYGRVCCFCCDKRRIKEYQLGHKEYMERLEDNDDDEEIKGAGDGKWKSNKVGDSQSRQSSRRRQRQRSDSGDSLERAKVVFMPPESLVPPEDQISVPVTLSLMIIFTYLLIGAVVFAEWYHWNWVESTYFSFVTLSTVGFGDYTPDYDENSLNSTWGKLQLGICSAYIVIGLAVLSMAFNLMMEEVVEKVKWLMKKLGFLDEEDGDGTTTIGGHAQSGQEELMHDDTDVSQLR